MDRTSRFVAAILVGYAILAMVGHATADSVEGYVRNYGKDPPNPIGGADVRVRDAAGKLSSKVITNTMGFYRIEDLAPGKYVVVVSKLKYRDDPDESVTTDVKNATTAKDTWLMEENGDDAYYAVVAQNLLRDFSESPNRRDVIVSAWGRLREISLPPPSKARLAHALNSKDASVAELLPEMREYLSTSPEDILAAQRMLDQAIAGNAEFPTASRLLGLKIGDEVVADLVLFHASTSTEPRDKRMEFLQQFLLDWKGTPASKRFLEFQKSDKFKLPWFTLQEK